LVGFSCNPPRRHRNPPLHQPLPLRTPDTMQRHLLTDRHTETGTALNPAPTPNPSHSALKLAVSATGAWCRLGDRHSELRRGVAGVHVTCLVVSRCLAWWGVGKRMRLRPGKARVDQGWVGEGKEMRLRPCIARVDPGWVGESGFGQV
jgi:hypothetical protein